MKQNYLLRTSYLTLVDHGETWAKSKNVLIIALSVVDEITSLHYDSDTLCVAPSFPHK